uniref:Phosphate regulating endopeptidase homolog, X-linked n=1 Tax=Eptatretus burgeri TaxID=7764 RepID=A0A8C4QXV7_EPTBU
KSFQTGNNVFKGRHVTTFLPFHPQHLSPAATVLQKMDLEKDPCDDFFSFSCGGWNRANPIPDDHSWFGTYPMLVQNVNNMLHGKETVQSLTTPITVITMSCFLKAPLKWPVLGEPGPLQDFDLLELLSTLRRRFLSSIIISFYLGIDDKNSSAYILKVQREWHSDQFDWLTYVRAVANYLVWRLIGHSLNRLSPRFSYRWLDFKQEVFGTRSLPSRWEHCVIMTKMMVSMPIGRLFIDEHFQDDKMEMMQELVEEIRWAFVDMLQLENDWMDSDTKQRATEKVGKDRIDAVICKVLLDETPESNVTARILLQLLFTNGDYFGNILQCLEHKSQQNFKWLQLKIYIYIYINHKLLLVCPDHRSLSYGAIGVIVGHELTHAFDNNGRKYNKDGKLEQWWSNTSIEAFREKAECMVQQYNNYHWQTAGMNVRGNKTVGENIADNGGLRESFRAYRRWVREERGGREEDPLPGLPFTHNQLFFISYAHVRCSSHRRGSARYQILGGVHSPPKYRVIGGMSNFEEFAKAFGCAAGTTMNRGSQSCRIW